jgi:neutral ceramidase
MTNPGYSPQVYDAYVTGIIDSIVKAYENLQDGKLYFNTGIIDPEKRVAFNRSIVAYNKNPDVEKFTFSNRHLAVDRKMSVFKFTDSDNNPIGMINSFAVHCTSIHNDNYLISSDNKGYASSDFENYIKYKYLNNNFVAAFAQGACGDVTPNFQYFEGIKYSRGEYEDDFKSAKFNGLIQSDKAKEIFFDNNQLELKPDIDYISYYFDFSDMEVNSQFSNGLKNQKTGKAAIGVSSLLGTEEGPGISPEIGFALSVLSNTSSFIEKILSQVKTEYRKNIKVKKETHGNKLIVVEMQDQKILGTKDLKNLIIPNKADPIIAYMRSLYETNSIGWQPWTPNILPLQIFIIDSIAIIGLPSEFTTTAGKRIKETALSILSKRGIKEVVLSCYTNGYAGYVTTMEEYEEQLYEGGTTHFGKWTLAAYQTKISEMCNELLKPVNERRILSEDEPHYFSKKDLLKRSFTPDNKLFA